MGLAKRAKDPALHLTDWLYTGAPAGLNDDFECLNGLFPKVEPDTPDDIDLLHTDYGEFVNYKGVD